MIATGMPIPTARIAASRRLRSRSSWLTADGPTPRPTGIPVCPGSIHSSLLGFGDFGADPVEKWPVRRQRRVLREERVRDLVGLEQQVLAFAGRRAVEAAPEVALRAGPVPVCEADHGQAAALTPVLLRIAPPSFFVGGERVAILAGQKERVAEI